jgi:hypothetical protein
MTKFGPLDMYQNQKLFGITRIPFFPYDKLKDCGFPTQSNHIILLVKEQVFHVRVQKSNNEIYSEATIKEILREVIKKKVDRSPPIGIFTSANRDFWATVREQMIQLFPENGQSFDKINDSLFAISLEDFSPKDNDREPAKISLHGLNGNFSRITVFDRNK